MGTLWNSAPMVLAELRCHPDEAFSYAYELGRIGAVQFRDVRALDPSLLLLLPLHTQDIYYYLSLSLSLYVIFYACTCLCRCRCMLLCPCMYVCLCACATSSLSLNRCVFPLKQGLFGTCLMTDMWSFCRVCVCVCVCVRLLLLLGVSCPRS